MQSLGVILITAIVCTTTAHRNGWIGNIPLNPYFNDVKRDPPPSADFECKKSVNASKAFRDEHNIYCIEPFVNELCNNRVDCILDKGEYCIPNNYWKCMAGYFCNDYVRKCVGNELSLEGLDFLRSLRNALSEEYDEFIE